MSSTTLPLVIIADDVEQWREFSAAAVHKHLPDGEIAFARTADEVVELVTSNLPRLALMALDWHYDHKGEKDFPYIINQLASNLGDLELPIVCVSGTVANVATAKALKQGLITPFIDKRDLVPSLTNFDANQKIAEVLGSVLDKSTLTKLDQNTLSILNSAAPYSERISHLMEVEDQIKAECAKTLSLLEKYKEQVQLTRPIELIQIPFTNGLETVHAVHEFKNKLYLAIQNIASLELAPESNSELQDALKGLSESVKKKYQLLINPVHTCDLIQELHKLIEDNFAEHKHRFIVSLDFDCLPIKNLDPQDCQIFLSNLIQNALLYGHPTEDIRLVMNGNELEISNTLLSGKKPRFEIVNNKLKWDDNLERASSSTGTGLKQIVEVANRTEAFDVSTSVSGSELRITIIINLEKIDLENAIYHDYTAQIEKIIGPLETKQQATIERHSQIQNPKQLFSSIAIIDHDGARQAEYNFKTLLDTPPAGFKIEVIDQHDIYQFWSIDYSQDDDEELIKSLLEKNEDVLSKSCMCMIHATPSGFVNLAEAIKEKFPHLVLLPLSSFPHETFGSKTIQKIFTNFNDLAVQKEELDRHANDQDLELLTDLDSFDLYQRDLRKNEFQAIFRAAQQIALARAGHG